MTAPTPRSTRARATGVRGLPLLGLTVLLAGCPGSDAQARQVNDRDTMTVRQRDSVTATLPIPGARGVGGALLAAVRANARAEQHDALLGGNRDP